MKIERIIKNSFCVIGIEGMVSGGDDTVQRLWNEANSRFGEVEQLAKRLPDGGLAGIWGAMSDSSLSFMPWEDDFSRGLYLAGVECEDDAQPPAGWTRWIIPAFEYLRAECDGSDVFHGMLDHLDRNGLTLAGAVHDFTDPAAGKNYMYFPVRRI